MKQKKFYLLALLWIALSAQAEALRNESLIPFTAQFWDLSKAKAEYVDGRQAITGTAVLTKESFENGTIEMEFKSDGSRAFPGITFRDDAGGNGEEIYLRPHHSGQADAIQYAPTYNEQTAWQLYYGEGYTANLDIPGNQWIKLGIEIQGQRALVFINNSNSPALSIPLLKGRSGPGRVIVNDGGKGVYLANFHLKKSLNPVPATAPSEVIMAGCLRTWFLSKAYSVDDPTSKNAPAPDASEWRAVEAEASGLVNVSRYASLINGAPSLVYARTVIKSAAKKRIKLEFGYSDDVIIFHNRHPIYSGRAGFHSREPQFNGLVGYNDAIYLDLDKGDNEIMLQLTETFGGWGFKMRSLDGL